MRKRWAATSWIALALAAQSACSKPHPPSGGRGILVISIDALRYDHLGAGGNDRQTSPELDRLASEGVFFESAYAAAPRQLPAHVALLSGCDPRLARRVFTPTLTHSQTLLWHLPAEAPHPAARFLEQDIRTAMFYDHENLSPVYGCERGFELYDGPAKVNKELQCGSEFVFRRFDHWLGRIPTNQSWFAYLQLSDLERVWSNDDPDFWTRFTPRPELSTVPPVGDAEHLFFAVPRPHWARGVRTLGEYEVRYDGAIARLDQAFKNLRASMETTKRWENTTIVVVGAYGMSFGESGLLLDSGTFADVDLHVPLIVRPALGLFADEVPLPPAPLRGARSPALVSTMDVLPTLLDIHHVSSKRELDGISFREALFAPDAAGRLELHASCGFQEGYATLNRTLCFERTWPYLVEDPHLSTSWFGDSARLPEVVREVLHDRAADPSRGHLVSTSELSPEGRELARDGEAWAARVERRRAALQAVLAQSPVTVKPASDDR